MITESGQERRMIDAVGEPTALVGLLSAVDAEKEGGEPQEKSRFVQSKSVEYLCASHACVLIELRSPR